MTPGFGIGAAPSGARPVTRAPVTPDAPMLSWSSWTRVSVTAAMARALLIGPSGRIGVVAGPAARPVAPGRAKRVVFDRPRRTLPVMAIGSAIFSELSIKTHRLAGRRVDARRGPGG